MTALFRLLGRPRGSTRRPATCWRSAQWRSGLYALLLLPPLLLPAQARAHAIIVASKPAMNASLPVGPLDIELTFNSRIDPGLSRLDLVGPDGAAQRLAIAPDSPPGVMVAHAGTTAAGAWKLRWLALSTDGHITRGEIPFIVTGKPTAQGTPAQSTSAQSRSAQSRSAQGRSAQSAPP